MKKEKIKTKFFYTKGLFIILPIIISLFSILLSVIFLFSFHFNGKTDRNYLILKFNYSNIVLNSDKISVIKSTNGFEYNHFQFLNFNINFIIKWNTYNWNGFYIYKKKLKILNSADDFKTISEPMNKEFVLNTDQHIIGSISMINDKSHMQKILISFFDEKTKSFLTKISFFSIFFYFYGAI